LTTQTYPCFYFYSFDLACKKKKVFFLSATAQIAEIGTLAMLLIHHTAFVPQPKTERAWNSKHTLLQTGGCIEYDVHVLLGQLRIQFIWPSGHLLFDVPWLQGVDPNKTQLKTGIAVILHLMIFFDSPLTR
jgi:hypothetical protein